MNRRQLLSLILASPLARLWNPTPTPKIVSLVRVRYPAGMKPPDLRGLFTFTPAVKYFGWTDKQLDERCADWRPLFSEWRT
jgi:hypothetical protein